MADKKTNVIYTIRKKLGMTQAECAKLLGLTQSGFFKTRDC